MEILDHLLYIDQYLRKNTKIDSSITEKFTEDITSLLDALIKDDESIIEQSEPEAKAGLIAMVSHSRDLEFQKKIIKILKDKYFDIVPKSTLAILEDKILIKETRKQRFGTQFKFEEKNGQKFIVALPLEDVNKVNDYRKEHGLNTIEEYHSLTKEKFDSLLIK